MYYRVCYFLLTGVTVSMNAEQGCGFATLKCGVGTGCLYSLSYGSASCSTSTWCESKVTGLQTFNGYIQSLHSTNLSIYESLCFYFEPLKPPRFEINTDPNPAFHYKADQECTGYRYRTAAIVINEWKKQTIANQNLTPRSDKKLKYHGSVCTGTYR